MRPRRAAAAGGAVLAGFLFVRVYRPWHSRWGATDEEVALSMPGDEIVRTAHLNVTRAVTVRARPEEIWPWIVQVGFGRAGFYSYDLFDNLGKRSAKRIVAELQDLQVGDWIPMAPGTPTRATAFQVAGLQPNQWTSWESDAATWVWMLRPVDGVHTRVITRLRCRYRWASPWIVTDLPLMELGDFPMMRRMLLGIRRRAEEAGPGRER